MLSQLAIVAAAMCLVLRSAALLLVASLSLYACGSECPPGTTETDERGCRSDHSDGGSLDATGDAACGACSSEQVCFEGACYVADACHDEIAVPCQVLGPSYLKAPNGEASDQFGFSVTLSGDGAWLAMGARFEDSNSTTNPDNNLLADSGAVYVFSRETTGWAFHSYVKASNPGSEDYFGYSVALDGDGDVLVVGANGEDSNDSLDPTNNTLTNAGAVYVYERGGGNWAQTAYLKASDLASDAEFGRRVAIAEAGNRLAVGASAAATAYVFDRGTNWAEVATLPPAVAGAGPMTDMALSGDGSVLAAGHSRRNGSDGSIGDAGGVFVFKDNGGAWERLGENLYAPTERVDGNFGSAVALDHDGDTLAVGEMGQLGRPLVGFLHVYTLSSGTTWDGPSTLTPSNSSNDDGFGGAVALSRDGTAVLVGARLESSSGAGLQTGASDNANTNAGAMYVFRQSGAWRQAAFLKSPAPDALDNLGFSVAMDAASRWVVGGAFREDSVAVGPATDNGSPEAGAAFAFRVLP